MEIVLGLTAAVCWGVSDLCARFASRRIGAYRTLLLMQPFGAAMITAYFLATSEWPHFHALGWRPFAFAAVAGLLNTVSSLALYYAFQIGAMSVAAPVSSAYPALTVTLALLSGERLDAKRALGLAVIFGGVILAALTFSAAKPKPDNTVSAPHHAAETHVARGAGWAIVAAVGYGLMFWWLGFHVVRDMGGLASVWVIRITTCLALIVAARPTRSSIALPRGTVWWLLVVEGIVDTSAFIANNSGMKMGHVSVVTVLSSLYGAVTVLLGAIFVRERIARTQWCGIFLIFAGIVLVNL